MIIDVTMIYYDSNNIQHLLNNFRAMVENYSNCINYDSIKPFIQDESLHGIIINNDNNKINNKICLKIKFERIKKGFSQEELAFRAGINKNTIWKIETGRISPTIATLEKICNALGLTFSELTDLSKVDL